MKKKYKEILLVSILLLITSLNCKAEIPLRASNGTILKSETRKLELSDTNKILVKTSICYKLNLFEDFTPVRTDTIRYENPKDNNYENVFGRVDQVVISSRNTDFKEMYRFEENGVYLAGYVTTDSLKPYIKFDPAIIVLPLQNKVKDSTEASMVIWNNVNKSYEKEFKTKSVVKLKKEGKTFINGVEEDFFLYQLTISRNATVNYGEHNLDVPDAVLLMSYLLYGKNSGLVAEWGIRSRSKDAKDESEKPETEIYLELNNYSTINNARVKK